MKKKFYYKRIEKQVFCVNVTVYLGRYKLQLANFLTIVYIVPYRYVQLNIEVKISLLSLISIIHNSV